MATIGNTAAATDVGSEVLRSVAQVVVNKAQAAGWGLLIEQLEKRGRRAEPPAFTRYRDWRPPSE